MSNQNANERERIFDRISDIKEEIYETKAYISSEICFRCSEMYTKLFRLEQELKDLQKKILDQ